MDVAHPLSPRHCERSAAIQGPSRLDCFVGKPPRNDDVPSLRPAMTAVFAPPRHCERYRPSLRGAKRRSNPVEGRALWYGYLSLTRTA
ncbi:MAG: hypothetical protein LBT00_13390 [Spirochaetaceae bacterium]|nr:hypothetical protein [Spirochaetaceae bacterium]